MDSNVTIYNLLEFYMSEYFGVKYQSDLDAVLALDEYDEAVIEQFFAEEVSE